MKKTLAFLAVAGILLSGECCRAQTGAFGANPALQQLFDRADTSVKKGNVAQAIRLMEQAVDTAEGMASEPGKTPPAEWLAEARIRQAQLLVFDKPTNEQLRESLAILAGVSGPDGQASAKQKTVAKINEGSILMRLNRPGDAVKRLADCDPATLDREQRPIFHFNYGRALEESNQLSASLNNYIKSLDVGHGFELGETKVRTVAAKIVEADASKISEVVPLLLGADRSRDAANVAVMALRLGPGPDGESSLTAVGMLLAAWAKDYTEAKRFAQEQQGNLASLKERGWIEFVSEVEMATSGTLDCDALSRRTPDSPGEPQAVPPLSWCTHADRLSIRDEFAVFLAATGRAFLEQAGKEASASESRRQAFARIYSAWTIAPSDLELARDVAGLSHDFRADVDPEGVARSRLIQRLLYEKGQLYRIEVKTAQDWENLLLMHTLLGLMFEADRSWGNTDEVASSIFQWTMAVRAEGEIRRLKPESKYGAPGLYDHLAFCYGKADRPALALDNYVEAARLYAKLGNVYQARESARAAEALAIPRTAEQQEQWRSLLKNIEAAEAAIQKNREAKKSPK